MNVPAIQRRLRQFAGDREWNQYHTPKNLVMGLSIEASELMEIFQWVGAEESRRVIDHRDQMERVEEELADVCSYVLRLADILDIDLEKAINRKISQNAVKYPPDQRHAWSM